MQEMCNLSLGWKVSLEEEMAPHFSILAWKIPWTEEPSRKGSYTTEHSTALVTTEEQSNGKIYSRRYWGGREGRAFMPSLGVPPFHNLDVFQPRSSLKPLHLGAFMEVPLGRQDQLNYWPLVISSISSLSLLPWVLGVGLNVPALQS